MNRSPATAPPSSLVEHAPGLMVAGVVGAHLALLLAAAVAGVAGGTSAAVSALLAGMSVAILWTLGQQFQLFMVQRADASAMAATLAGFALRVLVLGGALAFWLSNAPRFDTLTDWALALGCIAVSVGWLAGMLWRYSRLRMPIYDRPYAAPDARSPGD